MRNFHKPHTFKTVFTTKKLYQIIKSFHNEFMYIFYIEILIRNNFLSLNVKLNK